jgi:Domain of unknown function (DUF4118)
MKHSRAVVNLCGILLPFGVSAILIPARRSLADTAAALILVAVIAGVAILGTRVAGILASVSAGIWFDFFLTRPYERFAISHRSDLETTISLFVVGLIVTELAARSRHHRVVASEEADYVDLIYEIGEMVALGEKAAVVTERAREELSELLGLRSCRYESGAPQPHRPTVMSDGRVVHGGAIWGISTLGLPGPEVDLPVNFGGRTLGRFVLVPTPGAPVQPHRTIVAVAIAGYVGASLASRARIA